MWEEKCRCEMETDPLMMRTAEMSPHHHLGEGVEVGKSVWLSTWWNGKFLEFSMWKRCRKLFSDLELLESIHVEKWFWRSRSHGPGGPWGTRGEGPLPQPGYSLCLMFQPAVDNFIWEISSTKWNLLEIPLVLEGWVPFSLTSLLMVAEATRFSLRYSLSALRFLFS